MEPYEPLRLSQYSDEGSTESTALDILGTQEMEDSGPLAAAFRYQWSGQDHCLNSRAAQTPAHHRRPSGEPSHGDSVQSTRPTSISRGEKQSDRDQPSHDGVRTQSSRNSAANAPEYPLFLQLDPGLVLSNFLLALAICDWLRIFREYRASYTQAASVDSSPTTGSQASSNLKRQDDPSNSTAGSTSDVAFARIEGMGFPIAEIDAAMRLAHLNLDRAVEYLLDGIPARDPTESATSSQQKNEQTPPRSAINGNVAPATNNRDGDEPLISFEAAAQTDRSGGSSTAPGGALQE
ncbi:MAG: hypothetical protein Q9227_009590 [Pyrenula ochraceoflavens]